MKIMIEKMLKYPYNHLTISNIEKLISNGQDINYKNENGLTLLMCASVVGFNDVVDFLLKNNVDMYISDRNLYRAFDYAVMNSNYELIDIFLSYGYDINRINERNETPLLLAVLFNNLNLVKYLVSKEAIINKENNNGSSPLSLARSLNHTNIVEYMESILSDEAPLEKEIRLLKELMEVHHE